MSWQDLQREIDVLRDEIKRLTGWCIELTGGTMCKFCDVRCGFRTETYIGWRGGTDMNGQMDFSSLEDVAQLVAARALEIVLEKLEGMDKPIVESEDIQHVGYSSAIMGYEK